MDVDAWTASLVLSKLIIYGASAAAIGGPGVAALFPPGKVTPGDARPALIYTGLGCLTGLVALVVNFLVQVGAFASDGLRGMFDAGVAALLWQSAIGDALLLRAAGFTLLLIPALWLLRRPGLRAAGGATAIALLGMGLLAASYAAIGHGAEHGFVARALVLVHVLGVMWWIGALLPLWLACGALHTAQLQMLMHRFGRQAALVLAVLLGCGIALLVLFLESPAELFTTPYGRALGAKIGMVLLLLGLAALHKWRLVPRLLTPAAALRLKTSIGIEIAIAALVLGLTALLSTALGPAGFA